MLFQDGENQSPECNGVDFEENLEEQRRCGQYLREGRGQSWPLEMTVGFIKYAEKRRVGLVPCREKEMGVKAKGGFSQLGRGGGRTWAA